MVIARWSSSLISKMKAGNQKASPPVFAIIGGTNSGKVRPTFPKQTLTGEHLVRLQKVKAVMLTMATSRVWDFPGDVCDLPELARLVKLVPTAQKTVNVAAAVEVNADDVALRVYRSRFRCRPKSRRYIERSKLALA
jgi:hypothetical protein